MNTKKKKILFWIFWAVLITIIMGMKLAGVF
jgi:hypothetical protein